MQKVDILGLNYAVTDYQGATDFIIDRAVKRKSTSVFALPVHGVVEAKRSKTFKQATDSADLIVPDGQPIRWLMNWWYDCNLKDRVYGPELVKHVLKQADAKQLKVFLYGGATPEILSDFSTWIDINYPRIRIVGKYREPDIGVTTLDHIQIRKSNANIVLCGLGCPRQEIWIEKNSTLSESVLMGVGAAFSLHSGVMKSAPMWMQQVGLEWLYRLLQEPKRLWKRYLILNIYFIKIIFIEQMNRLGSKI